jgi:hypothetical protein
VQRLDHRHGHVRQESKISNPPINWAAVEPYLQVSDPTSMAVGSRLAVRQT